MKIGDKVYVITTSDHPDHGVEVIGVLVEKPKDDEVLWELLTKYVQRCFEKKLSAKALKVLLDGYTTPEWTEVKLS